MASHAGYFGDFHNKIKRFHAICATPYSCNNMSPPTAQAFASVLVFGIHIKNIAWITRQPLLNSHEF